MSPFNIKPLVFVVAASFAAPVALSQTTATLNKVVEQTLLTNPEVQARYQDFRQAMEGQNVVRGGLLPQVNAQAFTGHEWRSYVPSGAKDWNSPGYNLELRQLLFDGFATLNNMKQAGFDKLARYYDLLATSDDTAYSAVQAYLDLQRFRTLETLARENYGMHTDTLKQIRERAESGVGRRVDMEQAGGRLALAQTNLQTATANLLDVQARYRRITGGAAPAALAPAPDISGRLPADPANFNESLRRNPSLLSKQATLQGAQAGVAAAKGAFSPRFEFVASNGRNRDLPSEGGRDVRSSRIQLEMTYNLFRGGSDAARVRQTTAQSYGARDVRDYTCRNIQQDLSVAWNNVARLREQMPFLRDHQIATAKVRDAYRQQFQIGQRSLLDLLDTENELFEARQALVNAEFDLQTAQYRWLALSHLLLPAVEVQPANDEMPDENGRLEVTDEVIKQCDSVVPDEKQLAPVTVSYQADNAPPVLIPQGPTSRQ